MDTFSSLIIHIYFVTVERLCRPTDDRKTYGQQVLDRRMAPRTAAMDTFC